MTEKTIMRAVVQDRYGPAEILRVEEIPLPDLSDDQVLVRVAAASANPLDWHIMRGKPAFVRMSSGLRAPKQRVRGVDVAGRVEAVGSAVTRLAPGDEVFGWASGTFAECVRGVEDNFVPKPANLTFAEAAAVPVAGFTALQGLRDLGRIEPGHRVLLIGASGGVGTFAVQIAKHLGAEVTAVCSTRNVELVRSIGADRVVDYTREDMLDEDRRYDIIFQLAGTASPATLRRILAKNGTLVLSSGMGRFSGIDRIILALVTRPFVSQRLVTWVASENHADLMILAELLESGAIRPVIDRSFPLEDAGAAIAYVEAGHTQGKVVVTV